MNPRETRVLHLDGDKATEVTMEKKYGVWFVVGVMGALRLVDFSRTNGFWDTIEAVNKAARVLGLKIREDLEAWESEGGL